jgi:hypothetical protein
MPQRIGRPFHRTAARCKRYRGAGAAAHTTDFIGISGQPTQWENAIHVAKPANSQPELIGLGKLGKMIVVIVMHHGRYRGGLALENSQMTAMTASSASEVLDREFPEIRAGLLQLAAQLDRLDRAKGSITDDPRCRAVRQSIDVLAKPSPGRAEQIQLIFSRPYEQGWQGRLEVGSPR